MKKILLLNGSHSELALILEIKKQGAYLITSGNYKNGIGHHFSDEYFKCDFKNFKKLALFCKEKNVSHVLSSANDQAYLSAGKIADILGFSGYDSKEIRETLHQKDKFKYWATTNNIKTPKLIYSSFQKKIINKVYNNKFYLHKPFNQSGGKGIKKIQGNKILKHINDQGKYKNFIIEEFLPGQNYTVSAFIKNQKISKSFSDQEFSYKNKYTINNSVAPAGLKKKMLKAICNEINKIARLLNLVDGLLHTQLLVDKNKFFIIEMTRRLSGDFYSLPAGKLSGISWEKKFLSYFIKKIHFKKIKNNIKSLGRFCLMATKNGKISSFHINEKIYPFINKFVKIKKEGDFIHNWKNERVAIFFMLYPSRKVGIEISKRINQYIKIIYEK